MLHQRQLVLPLAGQLGRSQLLDIESLQQRDQIKCLARRPQILAITHHVALVDQSFDDLRAGRWGAEALSHHRCTQIVVFDQLARALHCRQQCCFGVARGRAGRECDRLHISRFDTLALLDLRQRPLFLHGLASVDRKPARLDQHFALGLESVAFDFGDARCHEIFGRREEDRQETLDDQVVQLRFDFRQVIRRLQGRDDGKVIGNLGVVEHSLVRLHPPLLDNLFGELAIRRSATERVHRLANDRDIVFGQCARISPRVGQHFVPLVQRLCDRQCRLRGESKFRVRFPLQ